MLHHWYGVRWGATSLVWSGVGCYITGMEWGEVLHHWYGVGWGATSLVWGGVGCYITGME